jgi:molybdopterin synthase sulfur carrier subunit
MATVRVRLFASLREQAGWSEQLVTVQAAEATPLSLWQQLQLPSGGAGNTIGTVEDGWNENGLAASVGPPSETGTDLGWPEGIRVAINQAFAALDSPLADGDELAYLPPISGG